MKIEVNVLPPVEPMMELTLTGIRSNYVRIGDDGIQLTLPLSKWRELHALVKQKIDQMVVDGLVRE